MKTTTESLALAALIIAASIGIVAAQTAGVLSVDMSTRAAMLLNMLLLAYFGNLIPKAIVRNERARAARRLAGWVFAVTGLLSAGLWIFAPVDVATPASVALVGSAVVVVFGYCFFSRGTATS